MSRWKALAAVRDVPESELRERLTDALDTLSVLADEFGTGTREEQLLAAVQELRDDAQQAREEREAAEEQLQQEQRSANGERVTELEADVARAQAERDDARAKLAEVEPLIEGYSDALAMARRFVSAAERAKVPARHVRRVKSG